MAANLARGLTVNGSPRIPVSRCPHGQTRKSDCPTCQTEYFRARYLRLAAANVARGLTTSGHVRRPADAPAANAMLCKYGYLGKSKCRECQRESNAAKYRRKQDRLGKAPLPRCPHTGGFRWSCPLCGPELRRASSRRHNDRLRAMGLNTSGVPYVGRGRRAQVCPHGVLGVSQCRACRRWISTAYSHRRRQWEGEPPGVDLRDWMRLVDRYRGRCAYCDEVAEPVTMDHVVPLSRGGRHSIGNVLPACKQCNQRKNARLLIEWRLGRKARRRRFRTN